MGIGNDPFPAPNYWYKGNRYAASFYGHDGSIGKATSPAFVIDKDYLHFKVGGGCETEILGVHLHVDDQSVYQEVGKRNNDLGKD